MRYPLIRLALLTILATGTGVAATAAARNHPQVVSGTFATLIVREHFDPEGGTPIEGYVSNVTVKRAGSDHVALRAEPPFRGTLHGGRYRVSSYARTCSGNCGNLDPPSNHCGTSLRLVGGTTVRITVLRRFDRPCELRVRDVTGRPALR
jgi:hypothetical protein